MLELPTAVDPRGSLTIAETGQGVPFPIRRAFFAYDLPKGAWRGGHAHTRLEELVICLRGAFEVSLDDGVHRVVVVLNRPTVGLYLPPMVWKRLERFARGTVYAVLASRPYEPADYIQDYDTFQSLARGTNP